MKTLLQVIQEKNLLCNASCSGKMTCGQCIVQVPNRVLGITKEEILLLSSEQLEEGMRLACCHQYHLDDNIKVISTDLEILEEIPVTKEIGNQNQEGYGVIVDIGTTTIVMKWIHLGNGACSKTESFYNPQASFGSDVIARIAYDVKNHGKLHELLITQMLEKLQKNQEYQFQKMIVCANTTMTHIFLNIPINSLGLAPFRVPQQGEQKIESFKLFPSIEFPFTIFTFPHISAFVGGDIVAGMMACGMDQKTKVTMMIDLGTNGEIAVGNKEQILTTSTAAGPAFEGVGITCGSASIPGAITKIVIKNQEVIYQTIKNKKPIGICGSGLLSIISALVKNNIITELGRFKDGRKNFYITQNIYVSEQDIQLFQLAKAAIQTGIQVLLREVKDVETIYVSGGFGTNIEIEDLVTIKLLPKKYGSCVKNLKNSALGGAYILLQTKGYERLRHITQISKNINLEKHPDFEDLLLDGLYL